MNTNYEIAQCLLAERCNANEIAEACQITRQSALSIIRRIDQKRLRKSLSTASAASTWMADELRMRRIGQTTGNHSGDRNESTHA